MLAVALDDGQRITTHISGAVRTRLVRVVPGDRVRVELSPYDLSRGRITELLR
jgi:translation initiation factor IF-1